MKFTADMDRLKQLLDNEKEVRILRISLTGTRRICGRRDSNTRKLNEKRDIEVAALKNKIKRLEVLDQLKKAESECVQVKDENATLRQMIAQLEAESTSKNKNDKTTAEAEKTRIKEDKSKLRERLAQLETENKNLKSDLSNALDDAKDSVAVLSRAKEVDNKMEQRLTKLEKEHGRLKKELEKALAGSSGKKQLTNKSKLMA
nr:unnamed protein product [Callosobruchus chinensis]